MNATDAPVRPARMERSRPAGSMFPIGKWRRAAAGYALGWPWFDGFGDWALRRLFLPTSRMWAAAQIADTSPERFLELMQLSDRRIDRGRLADVLARFEQARVRARNAEQEWRRAFFSPDDTSQAYRVAVEAERLAASHAYNATRRHFAFLLWHDVPPLTLHTETPSEFAAHNAKPLVQMPSPSVEVSRTIPGTAGTDYWLRFTSPCAPSDTVYARVHEPNGAENPPTIVLGHGICVEFDHWRGLIDEADSLCEAGFRVIRPEAPWHGRRTPHGHFGGERLVTHFPSGIIDAFEAAVAEWAVLAAWARSTSSGALAFGGTSLGAQIAQLAAARAQSGPEALRPEGLFLVTHCGRMADATLDGELSHVFGCVHDVAAKGWTEAQLRALLERLDPRDTAPVPPERVVTVLGNRDAVTPFRSVLPLLDSWKVPERNRFVWNRAHFSVPATLMRDPRPVERFRAVMLG